MILGIVICSFSVNGQDKVEKEKEKDQKEKKEKLFDKQKKVVRDKIQSKYVDDLKVSMSNFFQGISAASAGADDRVNNIPYSCATSASVTPLAQYNALKNLYQSTGGSTTWIHKTGWDTAPASPVSVVGWDGICVDAGGNVIGLELPLNGLQGSLPASFWNLTSLKYLNLGGNALSGTIPGNLGNLTQLEYLDLSSNGFTGSFPTQVSNLTSLISVNLDQNSFSGSIPAGFGNLANLSGLVISNNSFTGSIPSNLGNASSLVYLNTSYNYSMSGPIPNSFGSLTNLVAFLAVNSGFTGEIPAIFQNLTSLQELYLSNNSLQTIQANLGLLPSLTLLELGGNSFSGAFPVSIFNSTSIENLAIYANNFSGNLEGIESMVKLKYLVAFSNQFDGNLPNGLSSLGNLVTVNLAYNNFSGEVPFNFLCNSISSLQQLNISSNSDLNGKLPSCLKYSIADIDFQYNGFTFSDFLHLTEYLEETQLNYYPQNKVGEVVDTTEYLGFPHQMIATMDRNTDPSSKFQWFRYENFTETPLQSGYSESNFEYGIPNMESGDFGTYYYKVINENAPYLTLQSKDYSITENTASLGTIDINAYNLFCAVGFEMIPDLKEGCAPISATWTFGDGNSSNKDAPVHAYGSSGTYQVNLNVDFACGTSTVYTISTNKSIQFNPSAISQSDMFDKVISDTLKSTTRALNASFQTFTDIWDRTLNVFADTLNEYQSGKLGYWGPKGAFFFEDDREYSPELDLSSDGTFELDGFSHELSRYEIIPGYVKEVETMGVSEEGYFNESKNALGIYTSQLFGYDGGSVLATAVNARKDEILAVDFEDLVPRVIGNWVLKQTSRRRGTYANVLSTSLYSILIDVPVSDLTRFDEVTVLVDSPDRQIGQVVPIVCKQSNPFLSNQSILILEADKDLLESADRVIFRDNLINPRQLVFDSEFAHSGIRSMKFTNSTESITQDLVNLMPGKEYTFSAWISDKQSGNSGISDPNQSIEIRFETISGSLISSQKFYPSTNSIETWRKVSGNFIPPTGTGRITLTFRKGASSAIWIDDIRIHPSKAQLQSYVYDLNSLRISASLDSENYATYYFYDEEGKLRLLKKETEEGIVTITEVQSFIVPNPTGTVNF